MKICFNGYNITPQYLRTDKSVRITIDISQDQLENVNDILLNKLTEGVYKVIIEPDVEEMDIDEIPMPHIK